MADYTVRKQSDLLWVAASKILVAPVDGSHDLVKIPRNTLVLDIIIEKTVAYSNADSTVTIGFKGNGEVADPDAFMLDAVALADTLGSESMKGGAALYAGGKYFSRPGVITVDTNHGTAVTYGNFQVFVFFCQLKN